MSSTIAHKSRSRKRKPLPRKRPQARRRAPAKNPPATGLADWVGFGAETEALPGWKDLASGKNRTKNTRNVRKRVDSLLEHITTSQFALFLMVGALCMGLYVGHVFATRDTLSFLEEQRRENLKLELQFNQLKGQLDKKISPSVVYRRAKELGLEEGLAFGPTISWRQKENGR